MKRFSAINSKAQKDLKKQWSCPKWSTLKTSGKSLKRITKSKNVTAMITGKKGVAKTIASRGF